MWSMVGVRSPGAVQQRLAHGRRWRDPHLGATWNVCAVLMLGIASDD